MHGDWFVSLSRLCHLMSQRLRKSDVAIVVPILALLIVFSIRSLYNAISKIFSEANNGKGRKSSFGV